MATMAQAKDYFQRDLLAAYAVGRVLDYWLVRMQFKDSGGEFPLVDARSKQPRHFKTLDAAVRAIEEVGFDVSQLNSFDYKIGERGLF